MRNTIKGLLVVTLMIGSVFAQYTKGNTVIAWSKYKFKSISDVEDHKPGDRRKAFETFHTKRNKKAKRLLSSLMLTHYWTGHVRDIEQINEFRNRILSQDEKPKSLIHDIQDSLHNYEKEHGLKQTRFKEIKRINDEQIQAAEEQYYGGYG